MATESWTVRHFSQGNPEGPGQDDVSALLRRVADSIEALGDAAVLDITFRTETVGDEDWPSMTVYFDDTEAEEAEGADGPEG